MRRVLLFIVCLTVYAPAFGQTSDALVLRSCDVVSVVGWTNPNDCTQPLSTTDAGWSTADAPLAAPSHYFEHTFSAPAGTYHVWVRLRALNDSKYNDAVWLQFSDALGSANQPLFPIGTTSGLLVNLATDLTATSLKGWGWQDGAYWLSQPKTIRYAATGSHTIRTQVREDGVSVDEIMLSAVTYLTSSPGTVTNDATRFAATSQPPASAPPPINTTLGRLRVFDWNIASGYDPVTRVNDYNAQIDLIASLSPDVVTLQEVSYADADMPAIYANGLTSRTGRVWHSYYQRENTGTDRASNAGSLILTWLPVDQFLHTLLFNDPGYPAAALTIRATVNGSPIYVSTTHLYPWDAGVRARQLVGLQDWLSPQGARRILSGDFNAFPGETTTWTNTWKSEYTDAWVTATSWVQPTADDGYTFDRRTATQQPERIDYEWTKGMTVSEMFVVKTRRSDHHAIVTDYRP